MWLTWTLAIVWLFLTKASCKHSAHALTPVVDTLQNAGAVMLNRCPDISVGSSTFSYNKAKREGAALEMNNATGPVFNSTFVKNKVQSASQLCLLHTADRLRIDSIACTATTCSCGNAALEMQAVTQKL